MAENKSSSTDNPQPFRVLDVSLRLTAIPLCIASLWIMVTNNQESLYGNLKFSNLTGLKYLVCINAICAGYSLIAVVFSWLGGLVNAWVFFMSDQVLAYMMVTSGSAVAEILYLGYKGDQDVSWSEACSSYGKFCSKMKISLVLHVLALVCFLVLSLISAYRVFTRYEPPCAEQGE